MMRTLTPFFSIIIALVAFFFFTRPMLDEISLSKTNIRQFEDAIKGASDRNAQLATLVDTKRKHSIANTMRLDVLVPDMLDEVGILVDLKEIARSHNMLIGNIKILESEVRKNGSVGTKSSSDKVSYDSFDSSDITFSLIGTYDQFKSVLTDIETSLIIMEVVDIGFKSTGSHLFQFEVTTRVYALPPLK